MLEALQTHQLQHLHHLLLDLVLGQLDLFPVLVRLGNAQAKGHVVKDVQVGKEGVLLKDRVDGTLVRRHIVDPLSIEQDIATGGGQKPTDEAQGRGLAASGRPQ